MLLAIAGHPTLWIPAGDWAGWVTAIGTVAAAIGTISALWFLARGQAQERQERRGLEARQAELDRRYEVERQERRDAGVRGQAERVFAFVHGAQAGQEGELPLLVVRVGNASDLPIANLRVHVYDRIRFLGADSSRWTGDAECPLLRPHEVVDLKIAIPIDDRNDWKLSLRFSDDAGNRWTKYNTNGAVPSVKLVEPGSW